MILEDVVRMTSALQTAKLSGESQAKGRSGYYAISQVALMPMGKEVHVDFLSRRSRKGIGSARLLLTFEDARRLGRLLLPYTGEPTGGRSGPTSV